jgi:GT2 family glycosyltransferase
MISIIIPVFNCSQYTESCLKDLSKLETDHEIIIVDNGSSDNTEKIVKQYNAQYIKLASNLGFSKANNIGYAASKGDFVLFLNNDIIVKGKTKNWTDKLILNDENVICVQSGLLNEHFQFIKEGKGLVNEKFGYASGWLLCARRFVWEKLKIAGQMGPWNEAFFLYFEDVDLSFRIKKSKIQIDEIDIPIQHIGRTTSRVSGLISNYSISKNLINSMWKGKL